MYIGLVLVEEKGERYLFQSPAWSSITIGDSVVVKVGETDHTAKVINVISGISKDDSHFQFILDACRAKQPLNKVMGRLEYVECRYLHEEEE